MKNRFEVLLILSLLLYLLIGPLNVSYYNLNANNITAFGTLSAVVVALFGDWIRSKLFPSKVRLLEKWQNTQNNQGHTRLLFRNIGSTTAYEVEIYVNKIIDNGRMRQGFLPVPLIWTHTVGTETKRDIHPKQFGYYLDICRIDDITNFSIEPKLPLIFGAGVARYENIYHGKTTLKLLVSQKFGELINYDVDLEWIRGKDQFVRVLDFRKK
ncbi:MAG: hypothetical protein AAB600_00925 [Patescibacteria group bacterium]